MSIWKSNFSATSGLMGLGVEQPRTKDHFRKSSRWNFRFDGQTLDLGKVSAASDEVKSVAEHLRNLPSARSAAAQMGLTPRPGQESVSAPPQVPPNMKWPRVTPAWLKHDRQVLRFYAHFEEPVSERADETARCRQCVIMYFMEDGTLRISEPRQENSGITQGAFLKRHRVAKVEGNGFVGPADFRVGEEIQIYGRTFRLTGADRFTRWFFEENGINLAPDEAPPEDTWQTKYNLMKTAEKSGIPMSARSQVQSLDTSKAPRIGRKLAQFLENDRKVLRFYAYWDDPTLYGARIYTICHFFLCDNTFEIHEAHTRNSGRDNYPVFYKRGPLLKENRINAYPGMMEPEPVHYLPEDLRVGQYFYVWGRQFTIYDCDDFTQMFYVGYLNIDQKANSIDVSERPASHVTLPPPPHCGPGKEEDSLINCQMLSPKAPKQNLLKIMTMSDEILRFECDMATGNVEDSVRRLIIRYFPADDEVAVWETQQRNSGINGGKFCEKRRMKNPETGRYFVLTDFAVGKTVTINCHPMKIFRADEHTLLYCEAHPDEFPYADPIYVARKLEPLLSHPRLQELQDPAGADVEVLKRLAPEVGVDLIEHEVVTLVRAYGIDVTNDGQEGLRKISWDRVVAMMD